MIKQTWKGSMMPPCHKKATLKKWRLLYYWHHKDVWNIYKKKPSLVLSVDRTRKTWKLLFINVLIIFAHWHLTKLLGETWIYLKDTTFLVSKLSKKYSAELEISHEPIILTAYSLTATSSISKWWQKAELKEVNPMF